LNDRAQIAVRSRSRCWTDNAIRLNKADARRSADTHLLRYPLPSAWGTDVEVELYPKDETTHITGAGRIRTVMRLELMSCLAVWPVDGPVR
jgi:cysteine synthase